VTATWGRQEIDTIGESRKQKSPFSFAERVVDAKKSKPTRKKEKQKQEKKKTKEKKKHKNKRTTTTKKQKKEKKNKKTKKSQPYESTAVSCMLSRPS